MHRFVVSLLAVLLCGLPLHAQTAPDAETPFVLICPIEGEIGPGTKVVVERAVREARGAALLVFVVNTPGGRLDSAIDITNFILGASCPTVAYLEGMGAISAGALISYACDYIVMGPATSIGASTPFVPGMEMGAEVQEKTYSFLRSKYRALGEEKGHNPLLGEAMVDSSIELRGHEDENGNFVIYKVQGERYTEKIVQEKEEDKDNEDLIDLVFRIIEDSQGTPMDGVEREVRRVLNRPGDPAAPADEDAEEEAVTARNDEAGTQALPPDTELICAAGELLTLSAQQAVHFGLAVGADQTLDAVLARYDAGELRRETIVPNWAEGLYAWLTSPLISGLLLMCAIGGIYLEVRTPGFGLPGVIGVSCLAVFLGAQYVVGLASWEDVVLIVLGISLILIEVFVLPGVGLVGGLGLLSLLAGLYMSLVRVPIPEYTWDYDNLEDATLTLSVAVGTLLLFIVATWKLLPHTFVFRWLMLSKSEETEEGYVVQTREAVAEAVGQRGVAVSVLRPAGRGRFGVRTYDVVTRGEFLEAGSPIEIIEAGGNRYVVAACGKEEDKG